MGPQLYLILALVAAIPSTYGVMWLKREIAVKAAYKDGKRVGSETVAAATTETAGKRVAAFDEGERTAEVVSPEKAKIIELCKRSASCRERGR